MSNQTIELKETARWKTILQGHCAFRTSNVQTGTLRCKHLFTNTSECHFVGCPIIQSNYVALQRSYDTIYMVRKNADGPFKDLWTDEELPENKDEALQVLNDAIKDLNDTLKESLVKKFEYLHQVAMTIRESLSDESSDEDEDL